MPALMRLAVIIKDAMKKMVSTEAPSMTEGKAAALIEPRPSMISGV